MPDRQPIAAATTWLIRLSFAVLPTLTLYNSGLAAAVFFVVAWTIVVTGPFGPAPTHRDLWVALGLAATLVGLGAASALWSVVPDKSLRTAGNVAILAAPALLLFLPGQRARLAAAGAIAWTAAGLGAAVAVIAIDGALGQPLLAALGPEMWAPTLAGVTKFNKGLTLAALLVWPLAAALWQHGRWPAALALVVAVAGVIAVGNGDLARLGLVCGAATVAVAAVVPRLAHRLGWLGLALAVAVAPLVAGDLLEAAGAHADRLPLSALHRLEIWDYTDRLADLRPWHGWGLSAAGGLPADQALTVPYRFATTIAAYPHNAPLEVRVELGGIGLALFAGVLAVGYRAIGRLPPGLVPGALGWVVVVLSVINLSFRLWSDYTLFVLVWPALLLGIAAGSDPGADRGRR